MPEDAKEATGHGIRAKGSKSAPSIWIWSPRLDAIPLNAVRHGLTAEPLMGALEDAEDYKAFEQAVTADYDAQSAVERELVLRLASLLWRLRRATTMETGLFEIQADPVERVQARPPTWFAVPKYLCAAGTGREGWHRTNSGRSRHCQRDGSPAWSRAESRRTDRQSYH